MYKKCVHLLYPYGKVSVVSKDKIHLSKDKTTQLTLTLISLVKQYKLFFSLY